MKKQVQFKNFLKTILVTAILGIGQAGFGQTILASQDFETTPATPTITFTTTDTGSVGGSTGFSTGQSGLSATNSPALSNLFVSGTRGYRMQGGAALASRTFTFSSINSTSFSNVQVSFRVAGMSLGSNGNGIDSAVNVDFAQIEISMDGGTTWLQQARVVSSAANARWAFSSTGSGLRAYVADNAFTNFTTSAGGLLTDAPSTATITNLPSVADLRIRIRLQCDNANESWIMDDVVVTGTPIITWTGATSNLWSVATNWSPATVPDGTVDVLINSGTPILDQNFTIASGKTLTLNGAGSLTVNPTNTLTVTGSAAFNARPITFKSDVNSTGSFGVVAVPANVTGATNVTVERFLQGKRSVRFLTPSVTTTTFIRANWQNAGANTATIGTHITGSTTIANGFDVTGSGLPSMFTYDAQIGGPTTTGFVAIPNTDATILKAGVGYRILIRGGRTPAILTTASTDADFTPTTLSSTGSLTVGTVNYSHNNLPTTSPVLINNVTNNITTNGLTLIGNPYASPVDWHAVTKSGLDGGNGAYYTWDPTLGTGLSDRGRYVVYTQTGPTTGTSSVLPSGTDPLGAANRRYLQVGQAVFIRNAVLATPAALTFNESSKAPNTSYVFRSNESGLVANTSSLHLSVYEPNELAIGGNAIDGAAALFGSDYTTALDNNDVQKLVASGENLAFVRDNKNLAIETVAPVQANDVLFVKTIAFQANKNYTFKVNTTNFDTTVTAKMVDMYLNTETPINVTQPSFVSFSTTADAASYGSERFKIVFNSGALGNDDFAKNAMSVYPNPVVNNQFTVALPGSVTGKVTLSVTNMLGQQVHTATTDATPTMQVQPKQQLQQGVYVVSINNNGNVIQTKVIVKN